MKDNKGNFRNVRVLKKNMIFLQSYDQQLSSGTLKQNSTYSPSGPLETIKTKQNFKNITTYVTYQHQESAAVALIAFSHLSSRLRVLFGTVQYCKYFIRKAECRNEGCVFLHVRDKKNQIIVNDQIDQSVYDDHYDMALQIVEEQDYKTIKTILLDSSIDQNCLIKKGLRRAAQDLSIDLASTPQKIGKNLTQRELSTQSSELTESHDQIFDKGSTPQMVKLDQNTEKNIQREIGTDEYVNIRLIKKLIRENNSKRHQVKCTGHEEIHNRSKMMLYQIVKY